MEANKDTLNEAMRLAVGLETIHQDLKRGQVAAIYDKADSTVTADYEANDDFGNDEIAAINAICQRQGKPLFHCNFRHLFGKTNSNGKSNVNCRYCKKKGHMQHECQKCIAENGPMTNAEGKPFTKKVKAAAAAAAANDNIRADNHSRSSTVGSIVSGALNALNW